MGDATGLAAEHLRALDRLTQRHAIAGSYLAGGTAIAIHLHHRQSLDLDFFSLAPDADLDRAKALARSAFDDARVVRETDASVHLMCDGTPVDLVRYPCPPLEPPGPGPIGVVIAGRLGLAVMKLAAVARRGLRRDFWDLQALVASGVGLPASADAYVRRFGLAEADLYHVMCGLTYFDDAEKHPALPRGMNVNAWEAIKTYFRAEALKLLAGRTHGLQ